MTGESRFEGRGRGGGRVLHMLGRHSRIQIWDRDKLVKTVSSDAWGATRRRAMLLTELSLLPLGR